MKSGMRGLSLVGLVMLAACEHSAAKPSASSPEASYRQFAEALRGHDPKVAWELLSAPTKSAAEVRSKAVAAASQGLVRDDPMIMVLQSGVLPEANIGDITVVSKTEQTALLEVGAPTHRQQVTMVREQATGPWLVDLSPAFAGEASK